MSNLRTIVGAALRGAWLPTSALLALAALLASSAAPASANARAGAEASLQPVEASLQPVERRMERIERDPIKGELGILGAPLETQIAIAYDVHPLDVIYRAPLPRKQLFDAHVRAADGSLETAEHALRELLAESFDFRARTITRKTHVAVLRRLPDWPPLTPSTAATSLQQRPGRIAATGAPIDALIAFLRPIAAQPIVDETELNRRYDFVLEWDTQSEPYALVQAFGDLGLELVFEKREVPFLLIEQAP